MVIYYEADTNYDVLKVAIFIFIWQNYSLYGLLQCFLFCVIRLS